MLNLSRRSEAKWKVEGYVDSVEDGMREMVASGYNVARGAPILDKDPGLCEKIFQIRPESLKVTQVLVGIFLSVRFVLTGNTGRSILRNHKA